MLFLVTFLATRLKIPEATARIIAIIGLIFLIGLVLGSVLLGVNRCYRNARVQQTQDELNAIRSESSNANYQSKVAEKDVNRAEIEVKEKEIKAKDALKKLEEIKKKDSSLESPDAKKALERYCGVYNDTLS